MKQKLLLFADSTEGCHLAEVLRSMPLDVTACVTAPTQVLKSPPQGIHLLTGFHDEPSICQCLQKEHFEWVIDATHPSAADVVKSIRTAARTIGVPYLRLRRTENQSRSLRYVSSAEKAAALFLPTKGNVWLAVSCEEICHFSAIPRSRLYVHILPTSASLQACEAAQIPRSHIISMPNPLSTEAARALFEQFSIRHLAASDTRHNSSFAGRMSAAEDAGVHVTVIGRPVHDTGYRYSEILELLASELGDTN